MPDYSIFVLGESQMTISNGTQLGDLLPGLWHLSTGRQSNPGHSSPFSLYYGQNETAAGGGNYNIGRSAGSFSFNVPLTGVLVAGKSDLNDTFQLAQYDANEGEAGGLVSISDPVDVTP